MNTPPPDDHARVEDLPPTARSEALIAADAEAARHAVARNYPDETDLGKDTWKQLGIEKGKS